MSTLDELRKDLTVHSVRRAIWTDPKDVLELPMAINGGRGPWYVLKTFDPDKGERVAIPMLCIEVEKDACDDWEVVARNA